MRVTVIGTGHVGLVTCVTLAHLGHDVIGTDSDRSKIEAIMSGVSPFYEPGLDPLLHKGLTTQSLRFTHDAEDAIAGADVVVISVGTPPRASGDANLVAVEAAGRAVARYATGRCLIVEKSTVPTGTAARLRRTLTRERPDLSRELEVASNPEFLREGHAIHDALQPDRILVGAESDWAHGVMRDLYRTLLEEGCELVPTDIATAELAKHASNAFLALRISFVNALARLCERSGADIVSVANVMGADSRIGRDFLDAGLGYGGSCFPKDLRALERISAELGYQFPLLNEVARINDETIEATFAKVRDALWNLEDKTVALLGLAFKPGTDDIRFAPALALAQQLQAAGARVVGYDPKAMGNAMEEMPELVCVADPYEAVKDAHCVVLCTEWSEFADLDLDRVRELMTYPIIVDGRNFLDLDEVRAAGLTCYPTGRPPVLEDQDAEPVPVMRVSRPA
jgi:UDPglucose 6-dehydrogenase